MKAGVVGLGQASVGSQLERALDQPRDQQEVGRTNCSQLTPDSLEPFSASSCPVVVISSIWSSDVGNWDMA